MANPLVGLFWLLLTLVILGSVAWLCGAFDARRSVAGTKPCRSWPERAIRTAEVVASTVGVLGALLFAIPSVHPAWGFGAFLVSNLAAIPFNKYRGNRWILAQQRCFLAITIAGLWNWWLGPLVLG